jgi:hypothetical protein
MAQPTMNLSGMPELGTVIFSSAVEAGGISPGASGANQTWNFSAYPDTGAVDSFTFVSPESTPFASTFPSATIAYANITSASSVYGYIKESNTALELVGAAFTDGTTQFNNIYTNPQTIYGFPGTYNSTLSDTYRSSAFIADFGATLVSTGTQNYVIDGYGTLITSSGSYPNTLRIKKRDISTDSTLTDFGEFITEARNTTYEWVTVGPGSTLGIWSISNDTTLGTFGQPDTYTQSVTHTQGNFANVSIEPLSSAQLSIFPNPASDQALFMLPKDAHVSLLDIGGRTVREQDYSIADGSMPLMNISDIPSGTYIVQATAKGYFAFGKLVVTH